MPVGRTTNRGEVRAIVLVVGAILVIVAGIAIFLDVISNRGEVQLRLGDDRFNAGRATEMNEAIGEHGPILFSDVAGRTRDIWLNHLSDDPTTGWVAFEARRPGAGRECTVGWVVAERLFREPTACGTFTAGPAGDGLNQYPVTVTDGRLIVDLNADARTSTTEAPTTSRSIVISGNGS